MIFLFHVYKTQYSVFVSLSYAHKPWFWYVFYLLRIDLVISKNHFFSFNHEKKKQKKNNQRNLQLWPWEEIMYKTQYSVFVSLSYAHKPWFWYVFYLLRIDLVISKNQFFSFNHEKKNQKKKKNQRNLQLWPWEEIIWMAFC
jgi:uncharacterized membrane protein YwaF